MAGDSRRRLRPTLTLAATCVFLLLCVSLAGPAAFEVLLGLHLEVGTWVSTPSSYASSSSPSSHQTAASDAVSRPPASGSKLIGAYGEIAGFPPPAILRPGGGHPLHTEIFSQSTKDRRYFRIKFGSEEAHNPNIIAHPRSDNLWIVVAQRRGDDDPHQGLAPAVELVCHAMFINDVLTCIDPDGRGFGEPTHLPIRPTAGDATKCTGALDFVNHNVGPHDARVFYGPRNAYATYGSNSRFTCFGQWIREMGTLVPDLAVQQASAEGESSLSTADAPSFASPNGTELQRPPPYRDVERNWFLFFDADDQAYVHYDMAPERSFARLHADGSVEAGQQQQPADTACLARYLPDFRHDPPTAMTIHQATNSVSVTLCRRADPACVPTDANTFVAVVVQHKTLFGGAGGHAAYHPYVVLFRRRAPFALWAVGSRPLWVAGRRHLAGGDTEMMYVTSMAWRGRGQRYHGYADDVLVLGFGIEDRAAGGMDVLAADLLGGLGICDKEAEGTGTGTGQKGLG